MQMSEPTLDREGQKIVIGYGRWGDSKHFRRE